MQKQPPQGDPYKQEYLNLLSAAYNSSICQYILEQLNCINIPCQFCLALHWLQERVSISSQQNLRFENCCKQGAIILEVP